MSSEQEQATDIGELSAEAISRLIPHRYPMLFVDRISNIVLGQSATGFKNFTINEWFFVGHFPQRPVVPGVFILEGMGQTAAALVMKTLGREANGYVVYFMSMEGVRFRKPVIPGDTLRMEVKKKQSRASVWKFDGFAYVGNTLVAQGVYTAMIVPR